MGRYDFQEGVHLESKGIHTAGLVIQSSPADSQLGADLDNEANTTVYTRRLHRGFSRYPLPEGGSTPESSKNSNYCSNSSSRNDLLIPPLSNIIRFPHRCYPRTSLAGMVNAETANPFFSS